MRSQRVGWMDDRALIDLAVARLGEIPEKTLRLLIGRLRAEQQLAAAARAIDALQERTGETGSVLDLRADLLEDAGDANQARLMRELRCARYPDRTAWLRLARHLIDTPSADRLAKLAEIDRELGRLAESDVSIELARAEISLARHRLDDAQAIGAALLPAAPRSSRPVLLLARIALARSDRPLALRHLQVANERFGQRAAQTDLARLRAEAEQVGDVELLEMVDGMRPAPTPGGTDSLITELRALFEASPEETAPILETPDEPEVDPRILDTLRDVFGYDELRPGQAEVIERCLDGVDTLAIMPTGAGKSLTFQIPALLLDCPVVVVSPLIALMHDQLTTLPEPLRSSSTLINSTLDLAEMDRRMAGIRGGEYRLIYAAPERFRQSQFLDTIRNAGVRLVVIDEAHCISMWGHDFRPDYHFLPRALEVLGDPPTLAITATATTEMATQIGLALSRSFEVIRTSSFRDNLTYSVERLQTHQAKLTRLIALCAETQGSTIVYVSSRKHADEIAANLRHHRVRAVPYHAGMPTADRTRNQNRFIRNEEDVIVATVAFGMGINKPDVRMIVHFSPSRSLEAYIQESGRAGRDGLLARCILLASSADVGLIRRHANERLMTIDQLRDVYRNLKRAAVGRWCIVDRADLASFAPDSIDGAVAVGLLEHAGMLRRHPDVGRTLTIRWAHRSAEVDAAQSHDRFGQWLTKISTGSAIVTVPTPVACDELDASPSIVERAFAQQTGVSASFQFSSVCLELLPVEGKRPEAIDALLAQLHAAEIKRAEQMIAYLSASGCRHVHLARHLSEKIEPCGNACDFCTRAPDTGRRAVQPKRQDNPYFAALARWRTEKAREMVVPAFVVASDRLLDRLATERPGSRDQLLGISGIGAIKERQFGAEIIEVIRSVGAD